MRRSSLTNVSACFRPSVVAALILIAMPFRLSASPAPERRANAGFAGGAGAQFKIGPFAVRGEYERFNAAGGNPSLSSVGIIWKFL
jgi:hypothetical protein